jgi:hypothetical protein
MSYMHKNEQALYLKFRDNILIFHLCFTCGNRFMKDPSKNDDFRTNIINNDDICITCGLKEKIYANKTNMIYNISSNIIYNITDK